MPRWFRDDLDALLCAGDVFGSEWDADRTDRTGPVVVFSHDCDIDKPDNPTTLVASLVPVSATPGGLLSEIARGRVWHGLLLEDCREPGWVNPRTIRPIEKQVLFDRLDRRLHSMTPEGQIAIAAKVYAFLRRELPPVGSSPAP